MLPIDGGMEGIGLTISFRFVDWLPGSPSAGVMTGSGSAMCSYLTSGSSIVRGPPVMDLSGSVSVFVLVAIDSDILEEIVIS